MNARHLVAMALGAALLGASPAQAVYLQLYLEGGVYDTTTESWTITPAGSSAGAPFRLWAIGNLTGPGGKGTIEEVRLSVAYDSSFGDLTIQITPSRVGGTNVGTYTPLGVGAATFYDQSLPTAPVLNTTVMTSLGQVTSPTGLVTNSSRPVMGDGRPLPWHDGFGPGTYWKEFGLGDFNSPDAPYGDFIDQFPSSNEITSYAAAQINVYEISVTGPGSMSAHGATLHFDLYNHISANNRAVFSPFSHDSDGDVNVAPAPPEIVGLFGMAVVVLLGRFPRRRPKA